MYLNFTTMKRLIVLLLFIASYQMVQAQSFKQSAKKQVPVRNNVIKVSNLGAATAPLRANTPDSRFGIGLHHEKLLLDRVSFTTGANYFQSGGAAAESFTSPFQAANQTINVNTGIRTYLRLRKKNHHNGLFTGLNANYQYRNLEAQDAMHMVGFGVPVGYQKKLFKRLTIEAQLTPVYNVWSNTVQGSPEFRSGSSGAPKLMLNSHIGFGYAF
jgi:hypothetical protein